MIIQVLVMEVRMRIRFNNNKNKKEKEKEMVIQWSLPVVTVTGHGDVMVERTLKKESSRSIIPSPKHGNHISRPSFSILFSFTLQ